MRLMLITCFLFSRLLSVEVPEHLNQGGWKELQGGDVRIEQKEVDGVIWCRATKSLHYPADRVEALLKDLNNYQRIFDRVTESVELEMDVVYIRLSMPFPFSDRDYIAAFTRLEEGETIIFRFHAVQHPDAELKEDCVRLVNAGGEWRLTPMTDGSTQVSYTWNGELRGDFPDWALPRAWKQQGREVLEWLQESLENE